MLILLIEGDTFHDDGKIPEVFLGFIDFRRKARRLPRPTSVSN